MIKYFRAHLALLGTSFIFGANYWIAKSLMPEYIEPLPLVLTRVAGASLLFWGISFFMKKEKVAPKDLKIIALAALFGTTMNQLLFFSALNLSNPVDVSLIHVTNPIFVLIFAAILIRERITILKILGILMGATGAVILILYHGEISFGSDTFTGNLLAMFNMMAYAAYLVIIKPVMERYSPVTVMKWIFLFGVLFTLPFTIWPAIKVDFANFDMQSWLSLAYVVVATTFLAYLLTIYALKFLDASVAGFYIYLQPLIVAVIALWLGQQQFTWEKILSATLIFAGVYLVSRNSNSKKKSENQVSKKKPAAIGQAC